MTKKKRTESDSIGKIDVAGDKYWGAQTERSIKYFSIGNEMMPLELIYSIALIKKASAISNHELGLLSQKNMRLIVKVSDEILAGEHDDEFPLHVWMTGSGTQSNMNVNEVISNRAIELVKGKLGSKDPVHPNDHVNMSQSSNDVFPTAMYITAALALKEELIPALKKIHKELLKKANTWKSIVKIGRTHMQDAVPLTLGQEFSGYAYMIDENIKRIEWCLKDLCQLTLGGTAVGTGINAPKGFARLAIKEIKQLTKIPFVQAKNRFALQGAHDALVMASGVLKTIAGSLYKIANDIRLLSCGPRAGFNELILPANEPGSSIMPGKVNPTQCEALTMLSLQVMGLDIATTLGGSGGALEMNVYKPMMIFNLLTQVHMLSDGCNNFTDFLLKGMRPNKKAIQEHVENSLMLVTALSPVIGYDKASKLAHYAFEHNLTLKEANQKLKFVSESELEKHLDPTKMI